MIRTDGDRSLKRKWFAKKKLAEIIDMDIPAKAYQYEGFLYKVQQLSDEVNGGFIKAPMGVVVMLSSPEGVKIAVSDSWIAGCTGYSDYYFLYIAGENAFITSGQTEDEIISYGFQALKFRPDVKGAWFFIEPSTYTLEQQYSCQPAIMPYYTSEGFSIVLTDTPFIDLNNNGIPDFPYDIMESSLTFYSSNGSNLGGRKEIALANGPSHVWKTCIVLQGGDKLAFNQRYFEELGGLFNCATLIAETTEAEATEEFPKGYPKLTRIFLNSVVPEGHGMPNGLRTLMVDPWVSTIRSCGAYGFITGSGALCIIQALMFDPNGISSSGDSTTINTYFSAHPEDEEWRVFLSVTTGESVTLVNSDQFYALLQSKAIHPLETSGVKNWIKVGAALEYFFPWPNLSTLYNIYYAWKPHDSVMFHAEDDCVYTWTRAKGSVKFSTAGMELATLTVPIEVTSIEGVRPDISYSGNSLYFLACNKVKESIFGCYYGSLGSWTRLPDPEQGTLVYVRPAIVSAELIFLIGVIKVTIEGEESYRFAVFKNTEGQVDPHWVLLMQLPFEVGIADNFTACLYGDDALVNSLLSYPSPPSANAQNIVGTYLAYAIFEP